MLQTLDSLKRVDNCNQNAIPIEDTIISFGDVAKKMPEGAEKIEKNKILKIVSKILDFGLDEQK